MWFRRTLVRDVLLPRSHLSDFDAILLQAEFVGTNKVIGAPSSLPVGKAIFKADKKEEKRLCVAKSSPVVGSFPCILGPKVFDKARIKI